MKWVGTTIGVVLLLIAGFIRANYEPSHEHINIQVPIKGGNDSYIATMCITKQMQVIRSDSIHKITKLSEDYFE